MEHAYDYLIIGAGMAADAAAQAIHETDAQGCIGLVGAEPHPPYDRPPLSKALWKPNADEAGIFRPIARTGAVLHLGRRALALDPVRHVVRDDAGDIYRYRKLLLATGSTPRRLPFGGDAVIYFRTLDDYRNLRARAQSGTHVAVIGGGFIGSEIAAALAMNGCRVTLLLPERAIGARVFPAGLADAVTTCYRERGVEVRDGVSVTGAQERVDGLDLSLSDGRTLTAAVVVAGLGVTPNTQLAADAGLAVDNGIVVDAYLQSSVPDVYAAGDVAAFPNPALGRRLRVEHENAAITTGRHAGLAMVDKGEPCIELPFFYSDLFDLGYEAVGTLDARLHTVEQWVRPFREGVVYYLDDGRVRGVLLWNTWGQVDHARALIAAAGPFDADNVRGRLPS